MTKETKVSQNTQILRHMLAGKDITRLGALVHYNIQNITARISELRDKGYDVRHRMRIDPRGSEYAEYFLPRAEITRISHMLCRNGNR